MCSDDILLKDALYSLRQVMIHSGMASRGHYYMQYQVEDGRWFRANDYNVSLQSEEALYEEGLGGWIHSENKWLDTNAFMLIYKKVPPPPIKASLERLRLDVELLGLRERIKDAKT